MFRIGILECAVVLMILVLVIMIPLIFMHGYSRLNRRLKNIEEKLEKKK